MVIFLCMTFHMWLYQRAQENDSQAFGNTSPYLNSEPNFDNSMQLNKAHDTVLEHRGFWACVLRFHWMKVQVHLFEPSDFSQKIYVSYLACAFVSVAKANLCLVNLVAPFS